MAWRQSFSNFNTCDPAQETLLNTDGNLQCIDGCVGTISNLSFICTDFSIIDDWVTGTGTTNFTLRSSSFKV